MKLGILSDSHGRVALVQQALAVLDEAGADAIVHCGDVGGIEVLEEMAGRKCWFVWGNTDESRPAWRRRIERLGLPWPTEPVELNVDGKRVGVFHGHELGFRMAVENVLYDYILYGHTHEAHDQRIGPMRVINPGALHRTSRRTVALLEPATDRLEFLSVNGQT